MVCSVSVKLAAGSRLHNTCFNCPRHSWYSPASGVSYLKEKSCFISCQMGRRGWITLSFAKIMPTVVHRRQCNILSLVSTVSVHASAWWVMLITGQYFYWCLEVCFEHIPENNYFDSQFVISKTYNSALS